MPTYLYLCPETNEEFEEFHSIMTKLEHCPICEKAGKPDHAPTRLISGGSGKGIMNLSGDELVAKAKQDAKAYVREAERNQNVMANAVGESKYHEGQSRVDKYQRGGY